MKHSDGRLALAAILAPPVAICALSLLISMTADVDHMSLSGRLVTAADDVFFLFFFGAPIAYVFEAAIGIPAYRWLVRKNRLRLSWVLGAAASGGAISFAISFSIFFETARITDIAADAFGGAWSGLVAGATFWVVAFSRRSQHRDPTELQAGSGEALAAATVPQRSEG